MEQSLFEFLRDIGGSKAKKMFKENIFTFYAFCWKPLCSIFINKKITDVTEGRKSRFVFYARELTLSSN